MGFGQRLDTFIRTKKTELDDQQRQLRSEFNEMISQHEAKVKAWEKTSAEEASQNMRIRAEIEAEQTRQAQGLQDLFASSFELQHSPNWRRSITVHNKKLTH